MINTTIMLCIYQGWVIRHSRIFKVHKTANYSSMKQLGFRNRFQFGKEALLGGTQQTHLMSL